MSDKLIIDVRINEYAMRDPNPHVPYSPEEIADQALECWREGASIIHYHARDPRTGAPSADPALYAETVRRIRQKSDLIVMPTNIPANDVLAPLSSEARIAPIAAPLGATKLGCRLTVLPPGKKAFPHHVHHVNDELFVILSGEATLRFGAEQYPLRSGDVIVCPAGGAEKAHQLINNSAGELRYLSISSMDLPEVAEYPDSGKF